ncbi:23S rRNA (pseudouridine(1915)-N(3))-methyltransferase RlmH [Thermus scotoductus]|uniref:Ribosomal RNA large subunit methyltransferase H n=2 Tax=Thermus scotoductus TaxID=37636 RepID=A0A430S0J9_THESC|nr:MULTISPECIES: 23S rRNA (pseudouridine(1915)-N(3))-methyltransferase RlmH [Thermus]ETN88347.1 50S rRNA methyltransferase [Thermus sp. NMX2.A1]RTG99008.1 23S rRNA (pseudouridine(1915)-N(3))-methyltransferase RlmH [Thermus scotoductus]RTH04829.1 23S rRNA (pseudouridine(1915)-N(3))-methyltransferase RlmH [Thermus scotoductus]RTH07068.1 23S rRNA (pseudouridine(1915)-N(3))-methyltransferase RlmH [Thermus scotoductus]RTH20814.1 23S rRNA (pseudouridine(1915)-N(3))-methyltransferase RlmH [Thermus sc
MRLRVVAVGKPRLDYARLGVEEYAMRIRKYASLEVHFVKEAQDLLPKAEGHRKVVLDERGKLFTTEGLWEELRRWEGERVAFLVGGAEGYSEGVREGADLLLSLSPLTLQHELALLVLMEQLYRILTLRAGHPYHRP